MRSPRAGNFDMQLTPDYTLIIQVAIFIVVWLGFRALVFEPTQQVLADRRRRTVEAHENAKGMISTALADRERYEDALRQRRIELAQEAERARQAAVSESDAQIDAARAVIAEELAAHRAALTAQVERARRALNAESESIAADMLQRVTGVKWP
jgi:F0F1-type ATP synthase membrane subunit b/b'